MCFLVQPCMRCNGYIGDIPLYTGSWFSWQTLFGSRLWLSWTTCNKPSYSFMPRPLPQYLSQWFLSFSHCGFKVHHWLSSFLAAFTIIILSYYSAENVYSVTPTVTSCSSCSHNLSNSTTLSKYAKESKMYFTSNTTIVFVLGNHVLDRNIEVANVTKLTMCGDSSSSNAAIMLQMLCQSWFYGLTLTLIMKHVSTMEMDAYSNTWQQLVFLVLYLGASGSHHFC